MAIRIARKRKSPAGAIMAILSGGVVAAAVMLTPMGLIEMASASSGLPAIVSAAAPPLGEKARLLLAFTAGIGAMAFAFALNLLLEKMRNRTPSLMDMSYEEESIPTFNRADSHPDAPPRRPIFANSDFAEIGPLAVSAASVESSEGLRLPKAPDPLDEVDLECDPGQAPLQTSADVRENIPAAGSPVEDPAGIIASGRTTNHSHFSITELVDRFERGMAHRRQLVAEAITAKKAREAAAQEQPAWLEPARVTSTSSQNPQPDRKSIDVEVDEALRAALGTLQKMTARAA